MKRWSELVDVVERGVGDRRTAERAVRELAREFGGREVYIPSRRPPDVARIRLHIEAGRTQRRVAEVHGLSERHVRRLVKGR